MAKEVFNYEKLGQFSRAYYGFHKKGGRIHIDTKRIIKLGLKDSFPKALFDTPRNTTYFIPKRKKVFDYNVNRLRATIERLRADWNEEYREILNKIETPESVFESALIDKVSCALDSESYEDAKIESTILACKRITTYDRVVRGIHCQYLHRIFVEFLRTLLLVVSRNGYDDRDNFDVLCLCNYVRKIMGVSGKENPLSKLPHYKYFFVLNRIDNFLKHNTVSTYKKLAEPSKKIKKDTRLFLRSFINFDVANKTKYKNGMHAEDWIAIKYEDVNAFMIGLEVFAEEFCGLLYAEEANESKWNSDEALLGILHRVMDESNQ